VQTDTSTVHFRWVEALPVVGNGKFCLLLSALQADLYASGVAVPCDVGEGFLCFIPLLFSQKSAYTNWCVQSGEREYRKLQLECHSMFLRVAHRQKGDYEPMSPWRGKLLVLFAAVLVSGVWLLSYSQQASAAASSVSTTILGIQGDGQTPYPGIGWMRLPYATCGNSNLSGQKLVNTIQSYHQQGIRVLLDVCQPDLSAILDPTYLQDAAAGKADAVQCGNEQMKYHPPETRYVPPYLYAQFYDLCQRTMHAQHSSAFTLLGSLDPHVVGPDNKLLAQQVTYLDSVQTAMNTIVYPGGHWSWRSQIIGLIDSWHNGYPDSSTNNLYQLFVFWAQQFQVDLDAGQLGQHMWVVEGTACFIGCGLNNNYQVAVSHIITMITDVLTSLKYTVPFFYFTGKDFILAGYLWPMGVLDLNGNPKPLRQDLPMGALTLTMACASGLVKTAQQELLLARLYHGCQLPSNYVSILES
jgi:hypothetical protein